MWGEWVFSTRVKQNPASDRTTLLFGKDETSLAAQDTQKEGIGPNTRFPTSVDIKTPVNRLEMRCNTVYRRGKHLREA